MAKTNSGKKGYDFEELLRAYFLRAGFFVLRGVPIQFEGSDATDADLWLYERPTGTARRRQIADAKFKQKPKAIERLLWTRGLQELLDLDGAYVATTDKRRSLRTAAKKLGLFLIDGTDLDRMSERKEKILFFDRLTEEELLAQIRDVDQSRRNKELQDSYLSLKAAAARHFGAALVNIALDRFSFFARQSVTAHKNSAAARTGGRLAYFSAAVAAAALDYLSVEEPFKSREEREQIFVNAVRFGSVSQEAGTERLRLALALVRQYAKNGGAVSAGIESAAMDDFARIPAEIIAEQSMKMVSNGKLFHAARALEHWSFSSALPAFDDLEMSEKSFLGALLDFAGISREAFAGSWLSQVQGEQAAGFIERRAEFAESTERTSEERSQDAEVGPLFQQK